MVKHLRLVKTAKVFPLECLLVNWSIYMNLPIEFVCTCIYMTIVGRRVVVVVVVVDYLHAERNIYIYIYISIKDCSFIVISVIS